METTSTSRRSTAAMRMDGTGKWWRGYGPTFANGPIDPAACPFAGSLDRPLRCSTPSLQHPLLDPVRVDSKAATGTLTPVNKECIMHYLYRRSNLEHRYHLL